MTPTSDQLLRKHSHAVRVRSFTEVKGTVNGEWPPRQTRAGVTLCEGHTYASHYHFWTDGSLRHDPRKLRGKANVKRAKRARIAARRA